MGSGTSLLTNRVYEPASRQRIKSCDYYEGYERLISQITVYEPEEPEWTGLLDKEGRPIYRERNPIGFVWFD